MTYQVKTKPEYLALSITDVKQHLNLGHDEDDPMIFKMIEAATSYFETELRRKFITQTVEWFLDDLPSTDYLVLPLAPVQSIESISYIDDNEVTQTFALSNITLDDKKEPNKIVLKPNSSWPDTGDYPNAITIEFKVGYGDDPTNMPAELRAGILQLIDNMYEHRSEVIELSINQNPIGIKNIIQHFRYCL